MASVFSLASSLCFIWCFALLLLLTLLCNSASGMYVPVLSNSRALSAGEPNAPETRQQLSRDLQPQRLTRSKRRCVRVSYEKPCPRGSPPDERCYAFEYLCPWADWPDRSGLVCVGVEPEPEDFPISNRRRTHPEYELTSPHAYSLCTFIRWICIFISGIFVKPYCTCSVVQQLKL